MKSDLIWVHREIIYGEELAEEAEQARVEPGRLTFPERVIEVEANLHAIEQGQAFDVADRHRILEEHAGMISTQGQPMLSRNARNEHFDPASQLGVDDMGWVAIGEAVQFAIAHRGGFARQVEKLFATRAAEFLYRKLGRFELGRERDLGAPQQWPIVIEELANAGKAKVRTRHWPVAQFPSNGDLRTGV